MKLPIAATAVALVLAAAWPAQAQVSVFTAQLLGANEVPPVVSPGTGAATVTLNLGLSTLRVQSTFSGLVAGVAAAHIHCCTPTPNTANAGVATTTPTFAGFPSGVTFGSYDQTLNMLLDSSYNPAFITANGGTAASAFATLAGGLIAGQTYFNIHTTTFPNGEIRGTLVNVAAIPEPETYALLGAGLALTAFAARRRRAR